MSTATKPHLIPKVGRKKTQRWYAWDNRADFAAGVKPKLAGRKTAAAAFQAHQARSAG